MLINPSSVRLLLAALFSRVLAQEEKPQFIFDGSSFTSSAEDFNGAASIFRFEDIKDGRTFNFTQIGNKTTIIRLDLMDVSPNGENLILASWCSDNNCTSTTGFSFYASRMESYTISLDSTVTRQLAGYFGALLCFRVDWQLVDSGEKTSSWSQEWSVAENQKAVTDIFQAYKSTITAGASPVSPAGAAPTTVSNALFNTASPVTIASTATTTTTTPNPTTPTETAAERTGGTKGNKAWISGPVVGGIAAICLFSLGLFLYQRRRRRGAPARPELEGDTFQRTGDKPQLHSDHLPPRILYEMDASQAPCEADNGTLPEMAASEAPAQGLAADHHRLGPSEGGIDFVKPVVTTEEREKYYNVQDVVKAQP